MGVTDSQVLVGPGFEWKKIQVTWGISIVPECTKPQEHVHAWTQKQKSARFLARLESLLGAGS